MRSNFCFQAIITSINAKLDHTISLKVSDNAHVNLKAIFQDKRINNKTIRDLIIDSLNQPHNWKLFRDAVREYITLQKPIVCAKYYDVLNLNRIDCEFHVENALKAIHRLDETWKVTSLETMTKLLNSLLSKLVEDSIVSLDENLDSESANSNPTDSEFSDEESNEKASKLFINLLYDRASKCVSEEIVTQAGKPLLETFVRYIEHTIESTHTLDHLSNYLAELTDEKYSIEERGKEVIALQSRLFVSNDLHRAVQICYQKHPTEQLKHIMKHYNHST